MKYLSCEHCNHQIHLKTEYITFCDSCGKKIGNSFQSWKNLNPGKNFNEYCALFGEEEKLNTVAPKKRKSLAYWSVLIIIYAIFSVGGGVLVDYYLSNGKENRGVSADLLEKEWERTTIGGLFSFQAPFELEPFNLELPEQAKVLMEKMETYRGGGSKNLQVLANHFIVKTEAGDVNLKGAANGSLSEMQSGQGVSDFKFSESAIRKGKINGLLLQGSFNRHGEHIEFSNYIFAEGRMAWNLVVLIPSGDAIGRKVVEKIGNSITFDENIRI